jgi:hypothetical protein
MIYAKIAFTVVRQSDGAEEKVVRWAASGHSSLGAAAYAMQTLASGYYLGGGQTAKVVTVTIEEPDEETLNLEELRAALEAAAAGSV